MASGDSLLMDLVGEALSMHIDSEWHDAYLYMPFQQGQALLYEVADCLASLLRMARLPVHPRYRPNAEFISPNGEVPVLQMGKLLLPGFSGIVDLVQKKNVGLSSHLTDVEQADMYAQMAVIENLLRNVEIYITWLHNKTYAEVTRKRFGSVYKWPVSAVLPFLKRREFRTRLTDSNWAQKSLEDVIEQAEKAFRCLSAHLGNKNFLMGEQPTEADALLFGHLFAILTTQLPTMELFNALRKFPNLVEFTERIEADFFKNQ